MLNQPVYCWIPVYACVRAFRSILAVGAVEAPVPAKPAAVPKLPTPATLLDSPVPDRVG